MTRYAGGYVAVGEVGMWVHRLTEQQPYRWEFPKVLVVAARPGKRSDWLIVRDEAGREHRAIASQVYGEDLARQLHPEEARVIWGER